ncbi:MAG: AAA family ATPase [bacterium]|nr:AAA family ATPase [bacterium]
MISPIEQELSLQLRAGFRLIALEALEEERALRVLERCARRAERELHTWSLATGFGGDGSGAGSLDAAIRAFEAREAPAIFVIVDAHAVLGDPVGVRRLRDVLPRLAERRQIVVLLAPLLDLPVELEREAARLSLPLPGADELRKMFERVVANVPNAEADSSLLDDCVRAALGLTSGEAVRAFRKAWLATGSLSQDAVAALAGEKRKALHRIPALTFHDGPADLASVGGLGELKSWLRERRRAFGQEARDFGLPSPRGLLLLGVQGCGKSLCAKSVAAEWRFPLLRLDLAAAFSDPARSPELTIREATAVAESLAPVVIWIDEIEKGFAVSDRDPGASRVFGTFLTWLAEKQAPVFVVATANDVAALPPELLRRGRFDDLFFVDLPTEDERAEILAIHLAKRGRDPKQYPLGELAGRALHLSGAELEQVVAAALYTAFAEGRELQDTDLGEAIQDTVPLYETYEERIKELRNWARHRARPATLDGKAVSWFQE